jgi:hypothetical protein
MDTWSALLLCHENTKIHRGQSITFSPVGDRHSSLLTFEKSVAERHIENLKIMRNIGAKRYAEASRELTSEETLLRQKVYNYYNGPGMTLFYRVIKIVSIGLQIRKSRV